MVWIILPWSHKCCIISGCDISPEAWWHLLPVRVLTDSVAKAAQQRVNKRDSINSKWIIFRSQLNDCYQQNQWTVRKTSNTDWSPLWHHKWLSYQVSVPTASRPTVATKLIKLCFNNCNLQILVAGALKYTLFLFVFGYFLASSVFQVALI